MTTTRQLLPTEIPGLDVLLGGGLPRRQAILVTGEPGSGKTILCSEIAFRFAARGMPAVIATVTSEPHDKLLDALSEFEFFDPGQIGTGVFLVSAYTALKTGAKEARELLVRSVREQKAKLLFVDGLRAVRDLWQDEAKLREFLYSLNAALAAADCLAVFNTEYPLEQLIQFPEATTIDGLIALSVQRFGARRARRIEVVKLRGRPHLPGEHQFAITRAGIETFPRLESIGVSDDQIAFEESRADFGHAELDVLLGGGLPRPGTTVLAGSIGVGKTLLSLHFAAAGCARGEPVRIISFYEPPKQSILRALRVGLDVRPYLESGLLEMVYLPPGEREGDEIVAQTLERLERTGARRLVVDGLLRLENSILDVSRRELVLSSFVVALRRAGVSAVFTRDVAKYAGVELDFSDTPVASVCENLILLRYLELRGQLHRIVSVLKMRDSEYDPHMREFEIRASGLTVLGPMQSASGLLTGLARPLADAEPGARP